MFTYRQLGTNGALGNQLWQIAGTYGLATQAGEDILFPAWDYMPYFSVPESLFASSCDCLIPADARDLSPDYLQGMHYWWMYSNDIFRMLRPSEMVLEWIDKRYAGIDLASMTAVHVRRANNLSLPDHHPVPPLSYFEEAIERTGDDSNLIVFTDDKQWVKEQDIFSSALVAEGVPSNVDVMELTKYAPRSLPEAAFDLLTMTFCNKVIISNSSFSWWGALLSQSPEVYYPSRWYGPALSHINIKPMFAFLDWNRVDIDA